MSVAVTSTTEELFSRMQRVGLFPHAPKSAARHVSVVQSSPELWWNAPQAKEIGRNLWTPSLGQAQHIYRTLWMF